MTETKFTPGPWTRNYLNELCGAGGDRVSFRELNCLMAGSDRALRTAKANTTLAEAAPEMFEALKRMDEFWTESHPAGPDGDPSTMGGLATLTDETLDVWRGIRAALTKALGK